MRYDARLIMSERNEANSIEPCATDAEREPARTDEPSREVECASAPIPAQAAAAEPLAAAPPETPAPAEPERISEVAEQAPELRISQEESDGEWLDLSTRWLIAPPRPPGTRKSRKAPESAEPADWASSLAAQLGPPSSRRATLPPPVPRPGSSDPWAHGPPPTYRGAAPPGFHAPPPGWAAQPVRTWNGVAAMGGGGHAESDPWREEPSYTDGRMTRQAEAWASAAGHGMPPWAAELQLPGYAPGAWPASAPAYASGAWSAQPQPVAVPVMPPPWARASGQYYPQYPTASGPPPRARASRSGRRDPGSTWLEPLRHFGDGWLSAFAKLAIAAGALHYSGLTEPLLASWRPGSAPPPVQVAQLGANAPLPAAALVEPAGEKPRRSARVASAPRAKRSVVAETTAPLAAADAHGVEKTAPRKASPKPLEPAPAVVEPSAAEPEAEPPPAVVAAPEATLRINSRPWSQVFVDGSLVGHTPQLGLHVGAGTHQIRLVNPELEVSKSFEVQAQPGATISRVELLTE